MRPPRAKAISRLLVIAAAVLALSAAAAQAQIHDITSAAPDDDSPHWNMWPPVGISPNPEDAGREHEIDQRYRETLRTKIPNRKPSNDPWRKIRAAPAVPYDRHRTE
jgi:hypothetical protein